MRFGWQVPLLYTLAMGMEGCWCYTFIALLNMRFTEGRVWVAGLLLLYPVSLVFHLLLHRTRWPETILRIISGIAWVGALMLITKLQLYSNQPWSESLMSVPRAIAAIFFALRPEVLLLIATAAIWWLGRRLSRTRLGFGTLVAEFQFGMILLLFAFFISYEQETPLREAVPAALLFFLFGLIGISIAHAREGSGWLSGLHRHQWGLFLLGTISIVILIGWLVGSVISPDITNVIIAAAKWLWAIIMKAVDFLVSLLPVPDPGDIPATTPMPGMETPPDQTMDWHLPRWLSGGLRIVWTVLIIGITVLALWRISSQIIKWLRGRLAGSNVETETMRGAFRADLLGLFKRMFSRLLAVIKRLRLWRKSSSEPREITSIRHIYRQFLHWGAARGQPRLASQTPYEYLETMAGLLPSEAVPDLNILTQEYVRTRYSPKVPEESVLHRMKQSWHNIKRNRLKKK